LLQNVRAKVGTLLHESEHGFTLIDLIFVTLILAILAAITLPALLN
jgi:prepilin-type N-terminal cleavage/methylation domain-containing protein